MSGVAKLVMHVDVDAFFASVEQLLIPALRGRPVIVGSGVIASCSYEARRFGLGAGMPLGQARRLCPSAVVLEGRYPVYRCFAEHVWDVCRRYTCGLETYLDEAYGDATGMEAIHGPPAELGGKLQQEVAREVGLPVSVGLAANRMMAKIASGSAKPNGVAWVRPGEEEAFLANLPIDKLLGVGRKTESRLTDMNIRTVADLRRLPREMLRGMFGARGEMLHERCRGRDPELIRPHRLPRTISRETTFHRPTRDADEIRGMLFYLLERAMRTVRAGGLRTRHVELSIRYDDFRGDSAGRSLPEPTEVDDDVFAVVAEMLCRLHRRRVALRHVGIVLSQFTRRDEAGELFTGPDRLRRRSLYTAVDRIRDRWGHAAVVMGPSADLLGRLRQNDYGFVLRTPSLTK
ncbi:MAG TPA: DNA polymerase IV [Phycisphaerae bacterium]|nr:DNA polymerase IV [Phycisphaerae bacterium]